MTLNVSPSRGTFDPMSDGAERVKAVAEMARSLGMRVSAIVVGDIKLVLSEPWGPERGLPPQREEVERDIDSDPQAAARKRALREFGRDLPPAILERLDGVI